MSYLRLILIQASLFLFFASSASADFSTAGEYLIKFKSLNSMSSLAMVKSLGSDITIKSTFEGSEMLHLKVGSEAALQSLYDNTELEFIEPNYVMHLDPIDVEPLESFVSAEASEAYSAPSANTQLRESWVIEKPADLGTKTVVAVIDSGLDKNHALFQNSNSVWQNETEINGLAGVDDDRNGYIDDFNGWNFCNNRPDITDDHSHGTHVAGIVLGVGQDIFAVPVLESKVKIMALKFIDSNGAGTAAGAVKAIFYAVNNGAKVINNSWGGSAYSRALLEAYVYAYKHGVVIVSAAGNLDADNDSVPFYPANFDTPNNIAVLATDSGDRKARYSNYGSLTVSVGAPGESIVSAVPNGGFRAISGTSMAAPFVAGLAALISREATQLTAYQIKNIVMESADSVPSLAAQVKSTGRVNALKAISLAKTQINVSPLAPRYGMPSESAQSNEIIPKNVSCGLVRDSAKVGANKILLILTLLLLPVFVGRILRTRSVYGCVLPMSQ